MDARSAAGQMAANCLCFRSRRVARLITRAYDETLRPIGLQATQLSLLSAIALAGSKDDAMLRIANVLSMDLSTLSRNLRPLERDGLIKIDRLQHDRRQRVVKLTEEGERLLEAALPLWQQASDRIAEALGDESAERLRRSLDEAATTIR
jgi:DNA-binding MarR family transcriptional regulator